MCLHAFAHISRPPETFLQKRFFWPSGVGLKTCFDAFAHTSRPPETFFQKRNFLPSGVVKNVFWCICICFQTTGNFFFKKDIFERLESGNFFSKNNTFYGMKWLKTCFFKKYIFYRLEWLKTCFDAFAYASRPPETFFSKKIFLNVWSLETFFQKIILFTVWSG
jgi:hypothetical protein